MSTVSSYGTKTAPLSHQRCLNVLRQACPELSINSCVFMEQGQNSLALAINGALLVKYPRYAYVIDELAQESLFLKELAPHITLRVPAPRANFLARGTVGEAFIIYDMIPGESMSRALFSDLDNKYEVASRIGSFLNELHSLPVESFTCCVPTRRDARAYWGNMFQEIQMEIFSHIPLITREKIVSLFEGFLNDNANFSYTPALIHGDLGASNIIYNRHSGTLEGVIDFAQFAIDDPALDIASLICPGSFGEDFAFLIEHTYPETRSLLGRAKFYVSTFALQEALFGIKNSDAEALSSGIEGCKDLFN